MRAIAALVLLLAVAALANDITPVPLVMWSGNHHFASSHAQVAEGVNSNDLECMMHALYKDTSSCQDAKLSRQVQSAAAAPSVMVAFVFDTMGTQEFSHIHTGRMQQTKESIERAQSAVSAPYLYASVSPLETMRTVAQAQQMSIVDFQFKHDQQQSIVARIKEDPALHNALITVRFEASSRTADMDAVMRHIVDAVASRAHGNFVAVLTAERASHIQVIFPSDAHHASRVLLSSNELFASATAGVAKNSSLVGPKYITSNILLGLVMVAFLLLVLFVGINVITSIEEPVRFPRRHLHVKKEY